jgi:hypothetical protein
MKHLKENNETYVDHLKFAAGIGASFILRGMFFLVHGLCPIAQIPTRFNIEATAQKLQEWHEHTVTRLKK